MEIVLSGSAAKLSLADTPGPRTASLRRACTGAVEAAFHVSEGNFFSDCFAARGACDPANFLPRR